MRIILIDDEPLARTLLRNYLQEIEDAEIVGEFENGFDGLKGITNLKPDLVFLDIQMPKLNGFEMLELLDELPQIVFVTAYDQYAIKAFEMNAIDYLLKPYSKERLVASIQKAKKIMDQPSKLIELQEFIHKRQDQEELIDRIAVKTGTKIKIIYLCSGFSI